MSEFRLLSYEGSHGPRAGVLLGERVHDAGSILSAGASGPLSVLDLLGRSRTSWLGQGDQGVCYSAIVEGGQETRWPKLPTDRSTTWV